ncbi:MAG: hypothetical protein V1874_13280 [Spirochaetota bacterium]
MKKIHYLIFLLLFFICCQSTQSEFHGYYGPKDLPVEKKVKLYLPRRVSIFHFDTYLEYVEWKNFSTNHSVEFGPGEHFFICMFLFDTAWSDPIKLVYNFEPGKNYSLTYKLNNNKIQFYISVIDNHTKSINSKNME